MGKTYKAQPHTDFLDDFLEDDFGDDLDFDDDMDQYLNAQISGGSSRRSKASKHGKKSPLYGDDFDRYRLPRDWQDFDYSTENQLSDNWQ